MKKIYTKTGDLGKTGLIGGDRVSKADLRIHVVGDIDELNASIGMLRAANGHAETDRQLERIQNELFQAGAVVATADSEKVASQKLDDANVEMLECEMDEFCNELEPLKNFILPGGSESASRCHFVRTVCRRAERNVAKLLSELGYKEVEAPQIQKIMIYLNRLSDWFFVLARRLNKLDGNEEYVWNPAAP